MDIACRTAYIMNNIIAYFGRDEGLGIISAHVPWYIISQNIHLKWDWKCISFNKDITLDIVKQHLEKDWDWFWISANPMVTWEVVLENPELPWDWKGLSNNDNITYEIKALNSNCPWVKKESFFVPPRTLTYEPPLCFKVEFVKKWHSQKVIRRFWFRAVTNPEYTVCRKRLLREFVEIA